MKGVNDLEGLLMHQLQNSYAAEELQLQFIPLIIEKANHRSLKNALKHHLELTSEHKKRLEQIPQLFKEKQNSEQSARTLEQGRTSKGMTGLIEEANELLDGELAAEVTDAAIIVCVQKMEHYEICCYGTALAYAVQLHQHKIEMLLREILDEEYDADDLLTALATAALNKEALPEGSEKVDEITDEDYNEGLYTGNNSTHKSGSERTINSPGGRAGTSHRRYPSGESRGH